MDKKNKTTLIFTSILVSAFAFSTQASARPIEDIIGERVISKISKCDLVEQVEAIYEEKNTFDCHTLKSSAAYRAHKTLGVTNNISCQKEISERTSRYQVEKEKRIDDALKNSCVIDSFSFQSTSEMDIKKFEIVDQKPPEKQYKTCLLYTSPSPRDRG